MYEHRSQLRFSGTDAMGPANHARSPTLLEDARIGLLRSTGGEEAERSRPLTEGESARLEASRESAPAG